MDNDYLAPVLINKQMDGRRDGGMGGAWITISLPLCPLTNKWSRGRGQEGGRRGAMDNDDLTPVLITKK